MNHEKLSDDELVALSAAGDDAAFEILVRRHGSLVKGLAFARLADRERSEDLVQETFLRVARKLPQYRRKAKFTTWLYRIASNLIADSMKYARRHPVTALTTEHVEKDLRFGRSVAQVDERLCGLERRALVLSALGELSVDLREILILRDIQGLPYEDIAEITNCPMGTVKSRVSRARMKFKDAFVRRSGNPTSG